MVNAGAIGSENETQFEEQRENYFWSEQFRNNPKDNRSSVFRRKFPPPSPEIRKETFLHATHNSSIFQDIFLAKSKN